MPPFRPPTPRTALGILLLGGVFGYTETGILDKTHLHFYDRVEVNDIFERGGFTITDESPVVFEYPAQMLEDSLNNVGVQTVAGGRFEAMLVATDGSILQFVGKAVRNAKRRRCNCNGASDHH